jgi:putative glutamine transport system substrate-binding protein
MSEIMKRGKLIVGVKNDIPLVSYLSPKKNKLVGFEPDLARAIAKNIMGSSDAIEFKAVSSQTRIPLIKEGAVDFTLATMTITEDRAKEINFSDVYFLSGIGLIVSKSSGIEKLSDFKAGAKIGVTNGGTQGPLINKALPKAKVVQVENASNYITGIRNGRLQAGAGDKSNLLSFASKDDSLRVLPKKLNTEPYGMGVAKGNPRLLSAINAALKHVKADGVWLKLYKKNFGKFADPNTRAPGPHQGVTFSYK